MRVRSLQRITVVGRGRVGSSVVRAARAAGLDVTVCRGRGGARIPSADLVVLAVPDGAVLEAAARLAQAEGRGAAVVHVAGVLASDHLHAARRLGWSVGQAHPLVAVATPRTSFTGATLFCGGDDVATARARQLARRLSMRSLVQPELDRRLWHAVAAFVANGASTLATLGADTWVRAGVPRAAADAALAGLLASVARAIAEVGTPAALTGPVRRGDASAVRRHVEVLSSSAGADVVRLYAASVRAQIELARALGEADGASLDALATVVRGVRVSGEVSHRGRSRG